MSIKYLQGKFFPKITSPLKASAHIDDKHTPRLISHPMHERHSSCISICRVMGSCRAVLLTRISSCECRSLLLEATSTLHFHHFTSWHGILFERLHLRSCRQWPAEIGNSTQLTLYNWWPCRIHPTMVSPPTSNKTTTSPLSILAAFPMLDNTARQLATWLSAFTVSLQSSLHTHGTSAKNHFFSYGVLAGELCCLRGSRRLCVDEFGVPAKKSYSLLQRPC